MNSLVTLEPASLEVEIFDVEEMNSDEILSVERIPQLESLDSALSITRASVSRAQVPIATVAEDIAPGQKQFTTRFEVEDRFEEGPANAKGRKQPKKRHFLVNFFNSRGKKKEKNVNNNSLSMSDVVSAIGSGSSHSVKVKCCC